MSLRPDLWVVRFRMTDFVLFILAAFLFTYLPCYTCSGLLALYCSPFRSVFYASYSLFIKVKGSDDSPRCNSTAIRLKAGLVDIVVVHGDQKQLKRREQKRTLHDRTRAALVQSCMFVFFHCLVAVLDNNVRRNSCYWCLCTRRS